VGAGRRRRAAGAPVRRRRRQNASPISAPRPAARRRSLRRPARASPRSIVRRRGMAGCATIWRGWRSGGDLGAPTPPSGRPSRSTPCWSMRPAPRPAPSAAIPTCPGSGRSPISPRSRRCSAIDQARGRADQAGRHAGLLHLFAGTRKKAKPSSAICSRASRRAAFTDHTQLRFSAAPTSSPRTATCGRCPASLPTVIRALPVSTASTPRGSSNNSGFSTEIADCWPRPSHSVKCEWRGGASASDHARGGASRGDGARFSREPCEAVLAFAARRNAAADRADQRPSGAALAAVAAQGRPACDRAAGSAHRRRDARDRNLFRPLRLRRQGRRLRRPLDLRNGAAVRRMGGGAARLRLAAPSARRRIRHHPRQCARAGRRMDRAARRVASARLAPDVLSRRIISWLSQAPLVLQDADVRFYRRFLRSLVRQVRYLRHTAGDARRGVPACRPHRALLCGAVHRRPGAPHQIRHRAAQARDRAADPARRRPHQPRSRRDHRDPARASAAAAGLLPRAISRRRRRCSTPSTA
jgi:hypothetical protein